MTGPKLSSVAINIPSLTSVKIAGSKYKPFFKKNCRQKISGVKAEFKAIQIQN